MKTVKISLLLATITAPAHGMLSLATKKAPVAAAFMRYFSNPVYDATVYPNFPVEDSYTRSCMLDLCFGKKTFNFNELQQLTKQTELISRDYLLMFAHDTKTEAKRLNTPVTFALAQSTLEKNKELYEAGIAGEKKRQELLLQKTLSTAEQILEEIKKLPKEIEAYRTKYVD